MPYGIKIGYDKKVFTKMVDFITSLDPEQLSEQQKGRVVDLIIAFDFSTEAEEKVEEEDTNNEMIEKLQPKMKKYYNENKRVFDIAHNATKNTRRIV